MNSKGKFLALYIRYFNKALHVLFIFIVKHKEMRSDSRLFHSIVHLILMTISYTLLHNTLEISVDDKLKLSVSTTVECWIQYSVHLRALLVPYWGTCHQLTCSKYFNCRDVNKNWFHTKHRHNGTTSYNPCLTHTPTLRAGQSSTVSG